MLSEPQFKVLLHCAKERNSAQRDIVKGTDLSLGTVNSTLRELRDMGLVGESNEATVPGWKALEPYRVENAVIMAAGLSSRFAPISFEKPKGVLRVCGEVLIERQIRQLQEAGIRDIIVVVGYKKEEFFYLEEQFGVTIVVNNEYAERNNNSTIRRVQDILGNTYVCSSDDYFTENPFEQYVYRAYYAAVFEEGKTNEWCLTAKGKERTITNVEIGGENSWIMLGHSYWDRAFSKKFSQILDEVYDRPETASKLWESIYADHVKELPMAMRTYKHGIIWEFDSLEELREFDPHFVDNVDSTILDNICKVLKCQRSDIAGIEPIKQGLTNLSFRFEVNGSLYVYRHPGYGTEEIISRESEAFSQGVAYDLGLDETFIFEDPEHGWKVSKYIPGCVPFDYHSREDVEKAMDMARRLHRCGAKSEWDFDIHEDTKKTIRLLGEKQRTSFQDFDVLYALADGLNEKVKADGVEPCLCHNDFYDANFLVANDKMYLIDWEYSGMSDYASDLAVFICCSDYTYDQALEVLEMYFGRELTDPELFHCVAYISVVSFHWFIWALYKDMCGDPVGEFLYLWYKYTKSYGAKALAIEERLEK